MVDVAGWLGMVRIGWILVDAIRGRSEKGYLETIRGVFLK